MGELVAQREEELLADDVRHGELARVVGQRLRVEEHRARRQVREERLDERVDALSGLGGGLEPDGLGRALDRLLLQDLGPERLVAGQLAPGVRLVEQDEAGRLRMGEPPHPAVVLELGFLGAVHHEQHGVDALGGGAGVLVHERAEHAAALVQPRRVDEHELPARVVGEHAAHDVARGLDDGADDADLLADDAVDERGLAGVGPADDGDDAAVRQDLHEGGGCVVSGGKGSGVFGCHRFFQEAAFTGWFLDRNFISNSVISSSARRRGSMDSKRVSAAMTSRICAK